MHRYAPHPSKTVPVLAALGALFLMTGCVVAPAPSPVAEPGYYYPPNYYYAYPPYPYYYGPAFYGPNVGVGIRVR